jgi:hypothetical protein
MGRNSAFDHAGNVAIAVAAGAVGYAFSQRAVFLLVPVFAGLAVLSIPAAAIDYDRARDLREEPDGAGAPANPAGYSILFESRPLVIFGLCVMPIPSRQCGDAATGGTEAGGRLSQRSNGNDVGLHRCRPTGDAADRPAWDGPPTLGDVSRCS